jgi:hypothetical protein
MPPLNPPYSTAQIQSSKMAWLWDPYIHAMWQSDLPRIGRSALSALTLTAGTMTKKYRKTSPSDNENGGHGETVLPADKLAP